MGPFPHDAPPAIISAANPAGTDGFEFVEFAHPEPAEAAPTCSAAWATRRSPGTRPRTSRSIGRATSTTCSTPSPAHSPRASSPSMAPARRRWPGASCDARHAFDHAVKHGAEPYTGAGQDAGRARDQGHRRLAASTSSTTTAQGLGLRSRVRLARRARSQARGRRLLLPRPPHPQRLSRQHGQVVRLLRASSSTSARSASSTSRAS